MTQRKPFSDENKRNNNNNNFTFRKDIAAKLIFSEISPIKLFYVEINLRKQKWLICCSCNPKT